MKILMFTPYFYPHIGGVENHVLNLSKELIVRGNDVTVITPKYESELKDQENISGIKVYRYPKIDIPKLGQLIFLNWLQSHKSEIGIPDVIHGHDLYSKPLRWTYPKTPYFITYHGYEGYPLQEKNIKARKMVDKNVAGSIAIGDFIEKWYGVKPDMVSYGATDITSKVPTQKIICDGCFIGRLEKDTGVLAYFEALKILKERGVNFKLVVCGDGSLRNKLDQFTKDNKMDVKFTGMISKPDDFLEQAKLAFVSGYLSILGAMIRGKLVVSVYDNPLKEDYLRLIPGSAEKMLIAGSPNDLAHQIENSLKNPDQAKSKIEEARKWASKQTWPHLADVYLRLWGAP